MNTLNNKNNISSARTSDKKHEIKPTSSRANEKTITEIKKTVTKINL